MSGAIRPVAASDVEVLDRVVALIAGEQQQREHHVVYVGDQPDGIRAELDALDPPWTETLRIVDRDGEPTGATLVEWDEAIGRAWIFGPWVAGDEAVWERWAGPLVQAALDQLPATITSHELSGTVENERIRRLADSLGWPATEVNFAYVLAAADAGALVPQDDGLRGVVPEDHGWIAPLHELEFPHTYFSAQQLIERAGTGAHVVLVATTADGHAAGYAAGRIQPDGIGYIDFVAVEPSVRGGGAGRRLVSGLARRLLDEAPTAEVHLTVQEHRAPARALYAALGFRVDIGFVGYRSPAG
jgi:ribosomal protein S18 acetylase RimI-like enzyme